MRKIVYKKTDGMAHDLRFAKRDYVAKANETIIEGGRLPDIATLHSSGYTEKLSIETQRTNNIKNALNVLREKHKGKKMSELTEADVLEFDRLKMTIELELEI